MSGDMPCYEECKNERCAYCHFNCCMDNATCDERILEGGTE